MEASTFQPQEELEADWQDGPDNRSRMEKGEPTDQEPENKPEDFRRRRRETEPIMRTTSAPTSLAAGDLTFSGFDCTVPYNLTAVTIEESFDSSEQEIQRTQVRKSYEF